MSFDKVDILGVQVDRVTMEEAIEKIDDMIRNSNKTYSVFTPNSEIIMVAQKNPKLLNALNKADMLTADGIGVVKAANILKRPIKERVAGYDLAIKLFEKANKNNYSFYLYGSKPGVAQKAKDNILKVYPDLKIVGVSDGYVKPQDMGSLVEKINLSKADVLFVCLGAPKQELWIDEYKDTLKVKVCMGIGGSLDVMAGIVERAPVWCQKLNIEWLYRLAKQPQRIGRAMALPQFALKVLFKGTRQG